jgi:predicted O-methyltransferase YrrM
MKLDNADQADFEYLHRLAGEPDALMLELEALAERDNIPIIDREVGQYLSVMVSCMLAGNILEIGTAYGCSTLWMARAQPETGRIWTIDPDVKRTEIARGFFQRAGVAEHIDIINQPALAVIGRLPKNLYDIVLIDALKEEYSAYLDLAVPLVKHSGLVIVDNLLWHHRAAKPARSEDEETTKAIRAFNEKFIRHPALNATILPLGDGLGVAAKIE